MGSSEQNAQAVEETTSEEGTRAPTPEQLEEGMRTDREKEHDCQQSKPQEIIVDWDGPEDPMNPRNWSKQKKWAAVSIVSAYALISPIASTMVAPAAESLARSFHISNSVILSMVISIFVLAYAFGPLILGPLSEIFGRARVLQLANLFFLVFNTACGFSKNTRQFLAFRFLAGLGGSAPLSIGGGVLGDCFIPEERGHAVAIYSLAPLLGPAIGPLAGGFIAEKTTWRWVFWSTSFACCVVQIIGLFTLRETFHPTLLEGKAKRIRKEMGLDPKDNSVVRTVFETPDRHWQEIFSRSLVRPFELFIYEPIIQLLGLYMAFIYGKLFRLIYLVLVTIPNIYQITYKENVGIAGLHYIALGIGLTLGSQANARALDYVYKRLKEKNNGVGKPEFRLPSLFVGVVILPVGLLLTGWSAQNHISWVATDFGLLFIGLGMMPIYQSVQNYVIDAFTLHAASALASAAFLRSLAGFGFPLFGFTMYNALGYGTGNTILAVCGIVIGWPASICFWLYGEKIRKRSRYAT